MKKGLRVKGILGAVCLMLIGFTSCEDFGRADRPGPEVVSSVTEFSHVSYDYTDSSVDPAHHRSYDIRIVDSVVLLAVRDYDSVLLNKEFAMTLDQKEELKNLVTSINGTEEMSHTGENGSDGEAIVITNAGVEAMHLYWNQNETKEVRSLVDFMKSLTGNVDELVQSTIVMNDSLVVEN